MYSIKDLKDILGLSYQSTRNRILLLKEHFNSEVKGGNNTQYTVSDRGLTILQQVKEHYNNGNSLNQSFNIVKNDIKEQDRETESPENSELVKQLKERINHLESEIKFKNERIRTLEGRFLPKQSKSIMQRFKDWLS